MEHWKKYISGFYEASNYGRIRSIDRWVSFRGTPATRKGVVLSPTKNSKGYYAVVICVDGSRKTESVHRIIASVFVPNPFDFPEVNHIDGNPYNNRAENLEWCTAEMNREHAQINGFISVGNVKLTASEVAEIKLLISKGLSNPELAKRFQVDKATIRNIRIGRSWTHVKMAVESHA